MQYALDHPDEVFNAVGREKDIDPAFFSHWFENYSQIPAAVSDDAVIAMQKGSLNTSAMKTATVALVGARCRGGGDG